MTFHPEEFAHLKEKITLSILKSKCCKNNSDYRITYLSPEPNELGLCRECLSKEHYQSNIHNAQCIRCHQNLTDEVYKIIEVST